jgi:hypothetical protein
MKKNQIQPEQDIDEEVDNFDMIGTIKFIWAGRKVVIIGLIIGVIVGAFFAIITPKDYVATTILVPQSGNNVNSKTSQLGGLAALAGINIDMSQQGSEMSPILYPKIVSSVSYQLELMNMPVKFKDVDKPVSLLDYFSKYQKPTVYGFIRKYIIGLPGFILKSLKKEEEPLRLPGGKAKNQPILLTQDQYDMAKFLEDAVTLDVEVKEGYLTLTVHMPEAYAAAQIAQNAQLLLRKYIIMFKVQKAQADLEFIQGRYDVVKAQAEGYQYNLAVKSDHYKSLTTNVPQVESTKLQTKYGIANSVFMDLAKQLEQAKIQVKKDTPVFTVVEPVSVPLEKAKPNRPMIFIIFVVLGAAAAIATLYLKKYIADFKLKWKEADAKSEIVVEN